MRQLTAALVAALVVVAGEPAAATAASPPASSAVPALSVGDLTTNALDDPLGTALTAPTLGWQLDSPRRGVTQRAYEIHVASSTDRLRDPDVWDSGKVSTRQSVGVRYDGPALKPRTDYVWSVRVWDSQGNTSPWSEPARFGTGLGHRPWTAEWIGAGTRELGVEWTDYTIEFTASDISGALGVYVRGQDTENAYMWQISDAQNALRPHVKRDGGYSTLQETPFPAGFDFAAEHDYAIAVDGDTITTAVDGEQLDRRTVATFDGPGTMGFRTSGAERGLVHDVTVTSEDGTVLVDTDFPADDRTFAAGTVTADGLRVDSTGGEAWLRREQAVPLLRKEFDLGDKEVARARVYASARGVYELRLNGERVGDAELAPGWTAYDKRIDYQTYDVTEQVRDGANVLGAEVAPGWYSGKVAMFGTGVYGQDNSVIAEMLVEFTDGSSTVLRTDDTWTTADGPTREADLLDGESYDARVAERLDGWDEPGFDDAGWAAALVRDEPTTVLEPQTAVDVRVTEQLKTARRIHSPTDGVYLYDLGQNMVGHVRLTLTGEPGRTVKVRHGEVLNPDGTLYTANLRSAKATDHYTFATDKPEMFEPSFTFHGFRYVEISGVEEAPGGRGPGRCRRRYRRRSHQHPRHQLRPGGSAPPQHRLGHARQLPLDPDRHPGARRADGLDRRHQRLRPYRRLQHGRAVLPDQVAAGPARHPAARRLAARRRSGGARSLRRRLRVGRLDGRRRARAVDAVAGVRRHRGHPRELRHDEAVRRLPRRRLHRPHPLRRRLPRLAQPRRPDPGRRAGHRVRRQEHARVRTDGGGHRPGRRRGGVPAAPRGGPVGVPGGVHRRRRHREGRQPDIVHPDADQQPRARRPARRGRGPVRRDPQEA
ncbi:hypothetical protein RKD37_000367 [Streptomyces ambofaciens]